MTFTGINWWSILIGVIFSFVGAGIWFGPKTFYPSWKKAMGELKEPKKDTPPLQLFGTTFLEMIVQVVVLAWILNSIAVKHPNLHVGGAGIISFFLALAFTAAPNLGHRLFAQNGFKVWLIESSYDVLNLTIVGMIIIGMR